MKLEAGKAAFLAAITENPYDRAARLAYSDWLEERGLDDEAEIQREWTPTRQAQAEERVDAMASACQMERSELLTLAHEYLDTGDWFTCEGFDTPEEVYDMRETFWLDFMVLTGRPVPSDKREDRFISCSC